MSSRWVILKVLMKAATLRLKKVVIRNLLARSRIVVFRVGRWKKILFSTRINKFSQSKITICYQIRTNLSNRSRKVNKTLKFHFRWWIIFGKASKSFSLNSFLITKSKKYSTRTITKVRKIIFIMKKTIYKTLLNKK